MSTPGTTAVVFDLDGTLVDSEPNYYEASRQTLAAYGVTGFTWADQEESVGISTRDGHALEGAVRAVRAGRGAAVLPAPDSP